MSNAHGNGPHAHIHDAEREAVLEDAQVHEHPHHGEAHGHGHDHGHQHEHGHGTGWKARLKEFFVPHTHDASDSVDALEASREGVRALKISLLGLLGTLRRERGRRRLPDQGRAADRLRCPGRGRHPRTELIREETHHRLRHALPNLGEITVAVAAP